jgi:hypothetical protein
MKHPENIQPPVTRFMRETSCCPLFMACITLDQLKNYLWTDLPDDLADEVAAKAEMVFAGNARWRRKFKGPRGREWLIAFMQHWMSAALFKRNRRLALLLPGEFTFGGKPLPLTPLPLQLRQSAPKRVRRKRAPSRPRTCFAHGCELLAV